MNDLPTPRLSLNQAVFVTVWTLIPVVAVLLIHVLS